MNNISAKGKAALWVGVVFLLGAALGGVLGYVFTYRSYASQATQLNEQARRQQRVAELTQQLSLTHDQAQQLDSIIKSMQAQFKTIRRQVDPELEDARQRGRNQIRAILTPEQKPKFEDFLKHLDEERLKNAR
jgi:septal ring factor EnvC (AmiA/AmiB activator)